MGLSVRPDAVPALDPDADLLVSRERILGFVGTADVAAVDGIEVADLRAVLERVDGRHTAGEIARSLAARYDPDSVLAVLAALVGRGIRLIGEEAGDDRQRELPPRARTAALLVMGGGDVGRAIAHALRQAGAERVELLAAGPLEGCVDADFLEADRARRLIPRAEASAVASPAMSRVELRGHLRGRDLVVVATEGVPLEVPLEVTRAALELEVPALFALPQGGAMVLGPTMVPWKSPCLACSRLGAVLRTARPEVALDLLPHVWVGRIDPAVAPPWLLPLVADEVRREVSAFFSGRHPRFLYQLLRIHPVRGRSVEEVEPTTECPECRGLSRSAIHRGRPELPARRLVWSGLGVVERAGGLRSIPPDEARRRAEAAMNMLGVEIAMEPPDGDRTPEWAMRSGCAYFAVRREPRFDPTRPWIVRADGAPAFGKGVSEAQAWCSAAFEWLERERANYVGDVEIVRAPYRDVVDLALDVPRYLAGLVPELDCGVRFDPDREIDWLWGMCLRRRRPILLPAAATYPVKGRFRGSDIHWPRRGSSGQAAGCTLEDTVLEGLLEVIEHDAGYTAYRTGLPFPRIDLATVGDPVAREIIERLERASCSLQARDMTTDLGVPVIEVYVLNASDPLRCFACGRGAHLDPLIALRRALTEALQCVFAIDSPRDEPNGSHLSLYARFPHAKHMLGRFRGTRSLAELPDLSVGLDAGRAVDRVVELVSGALPDHDVCFVDRSRPELVGVHVVAVLVSGVLDEVTEAAAHIPARIRSHAPLEEMFLRRCD